MPRPRSLKSLLEENEEMAKLGWECYRRNNDYRKGYAELFKTVIDDEEIKGLLKFEDIKTEADLVRWRQEQEALQQKLGTRPYVFKSDLARLRNLKPDESYCGAPLVIPSGHAHLVMFCEEWRIRYPKNPDRDFQDNNDKNLFEGFSAVTVTKHPHELAAEGAFRALEKLKFLTIGRNDMLRKNNFSDSKFREIELADAINIVWRDWKATEESGRKLRDNGEATFVANANRSLDEITAPIGGYLNSIAQKRHQKVKNLLAEWRVMIEIWDLRKGYKKGNNENEEMGFSRIADRLHLKDLDTDKAGRLFRRMDRVIQACTSKKWPGAMYEKGRGVHPI